ncbi:hypothetical protein BpHYR1_038896 [Brachionus plicatilis]|uniref:Uncharacterized protein n=1 Tax=Brachionus plicatilis TaxID=10195 RepID=A0A3M7P5F9_BRAPC|nr:hypothetical protein BpHYR1_038896 [Brachionus plicatilis]
MFLIFQKNIWKNVQMIVLMNVIQN